MRSGRKVEYQDEEARNFGQYHLQHCALQSSLHFSFLLGFSKNDAVYKSFEVAVDRKTLKLPFTLESAPDWTCPTCQKAPLRIRKESFFREEAFYSRDHSH